MFVRIGLMAAAALILTACGGGGDGNSSGSSSRAPTTTVKVVGDSLSDSGTFGFKFTVQGNPAYPIWTERVATALAVSVPCARYAAPGGVPALNPAAATCTSFGVGGAAINPRGTANDATPLSIVQQLKDLRTQGPYNVQDLLLVDGGGNDFTDLVTDYAKSRIRGDSAAFDSLTSELVPADDKIGLLRVQVGDLYAARLADLLVDALLTEALNRDAQRVVVLNVPDLTRTPKFAGALSIALLLDPAGAVEVRRAAEQWVSIFNARLSARLAVQSRVVVVDFYAELNKWLNMPGAYGLTNTSDPACRGNIATCTEVSLSAMQPANPNWWRTYVFSDDFHGTPRTNELMGDAVVKAVEAKGWR